MKLLLPLLHSQQAAAITGEQHGMLMQRRYPPVGGVSAAAGSTVGIHSEQRQQQPGSPAVAGASRAAAGQPGVAAMRGRGAAAAYTAAAAAAPAGSAGVPAVPPVSQPSTDSASFRVWMGNSSSGGAMGQPAHVAGHGPGSAAGAAASGAVRSSTLQELQPAGTAASVQQQQPQQQQPGRGPAGVGSGSGSDVATCGSNQEAGGGDGRGSVGADAVAYELEVLAIVPGRGSLTGQPVLSDAARQQQAPPLDVRGLSHDVEPHLQPPKQLKGCSGWVRRHLSLNMRAPGKAGKQGLSWLGLAGCCSSQKGGEKRGQQQQQQKPAYG
ncbi:hypothetical protein COO60DRAFT_358218 [Scenedesmus sp. NREL 46B-D3]|nr:hypothetical protein COO60DRAFT_358218 [Scenedesmus sp. NREL 46B-D3]